VLVVLNEHQAMEGAVCLCVPVNESPYCMLSRGSEHSFSNMGTVSPPACGLIGVAAMDCFAGIESREA
jgi:hypothetical protein